MIIAVARRVTHPAFGTAFFGFCPKTLCGSKNSTVRWLPELSGGLLTRLCGNRVECQMIRGVGAT